MISNSIVIPVFVAAGVTMLMRVLPALFTSVERLYEYPRIVKFLDYTVCLILGELIFHMAIRDLPQNADYWPLFVLSIATLTLSGLWMYYSQCLLKSFLVGFIFFTCFAYLFG